ncbi:MAG: lytic transglycosylase domain-containing protein [Clostridiales bacterium]|nr:lytic transglycosylase domain-containing protein [Clostridiales bacterium]
MKNKIATFLIFITAAAVLVFSFGIAERAVFYPVKFKEEVLSAASAFSVDEKVIFAVIKTESGFKSGAVSGKGAVGLMQIMPSTGEYLYNKLYKNAEKKFEREMLFRADLNIELGTYYIKYLLDRFDGELDWALAAYNAGEGNAAAWRGAGISIGGLPYKETREYIVKFKRAYKKYNKLYS